MKVLLDTNIIIHREASTVIREDIGKLFSWLDRLHCEKCIHPITLEEIERHKDEKTVKTFKVKLDNYVLLKTEAPLSTEVIKLSQKEDVSANDINDTRLLNEVFHKRVDSSLGLTP